MTDFSKRFQTRQQMYMSGLDLKEQLCREEEFAVELRKQKRERQVKLRRAVIANMHLQQVTPNKDGAMPEDELGRLYPGLKSSIPLSSKVELLLYLLSRHDLTLETLQAIRLLRKLFSTKSDQYRIQLTQEALWYLHREDLVWQREAAWLVSNLVSTSSGAGRDVLTLAGDVRLVELLNNEDQEVLENVLYALGNIACECVSTCQRLLSLGVDDHVLSLIRRKSNCIPVLKVSTWVLSSLLCYHLDPVKVRSIAEILVFLRNKPSGSIRKLVVSCIQNIVKMGNSHIMIVMNLGLIKPLVDYLDASSKMTLDLIKIFVDITTGDAKVTQLVLDLGVLEKIHGKLNDQDDWIRARTVDVLANVAAGTKEQVSVVVNHPILRDALHKITDSSPRVRQSVSRLLYNLSMRGTWDHMVALVSFSIISTVKPGLDDSDSKVILVLSTQNILRFLENILELARTNSTPMIQNRLNDTGCTDQLEKLHHHDSPAVASCANGILTRYFDSQMGEIRTEEAPPTFVFS